MRYINEIIVHCTATRPEWYAGRGVHDKVKEIWRWHVEDRGWSDIGYHYIIDRDGSIAPGRPVERVGAHVKGRNSNSIGVSLVGGFGGATTDQFEDHFTPEQDQALRDLLKQLQADYPSVKIISGHHDYAAKACPCFEVNKWLNREVKPATSPRAPITPQAQTTTPDWLDAILDLFRGMKR